MSESVRKAEDWQRVYELVYACSGITDIKIFANVVLDEFRHLIPCEQARAYIYKTNGNIDEYFLRGVDKRIVKDYFDYYSLLNQRQWSVRSRSEVIPFMDPNKPETVYGVIEWASEPRTEFVRDVVDKLNIKYSLGFGFRDNDRMLRANIILDRTSNTKFTEREQWYVLKAVPLLNNYFKLLVDQTSRATGSYRELPDYLTLTMREREIVDLMFEGVSTRNVSKRLRIAESTVNKHLAHIYTKMNVQNRQELLSKLARG